MNDKLNKAINFASYSQALAVTRKTLKEKIDAKLTYGHASGIFKINQTLITFVQMLIDKGRTSNVLLLDSNDTPIMISDLEQFRDEIFDRYFSSTAEYYNTIKELNKSRSIEKLLEL